MPLFGDPAMQYLEALVGAPVLRLSTAEHLANPGDIVVDADTAAHLAADLHVAEWRLDAATGERFAVATELRRLAGRREKPGICVMPSMR
jgi:hypothetical protein